MQSHTHQRRQQKHDNRSNQFEERHLRDQNLISYSCAATVYYEKKNKFIDQNTEN